MGTGILFESKEWSSYTLEKRMNEMGAPAKLIDMEEDIDVGELLSFDLVVNRICGSAGFRGHHKSLLKAPETIAQLREHKVPMLNDGDAHFYETGKELASRALAKSGLPVPKVHGVFTPGGIPDEAAVKYPCVVKPDCGGRTNCTYIVRNPADLRAAMKDAPDIKFICQEFIMPERGYLTRIEIIGYSCRLALKRSVAENGLSSYNVGSVYASYPDFPNTVREAAERAARLLKIETGSFDVIETGRGFFFIDTNSVSNASEDSTELFVREFGFDLVEETAAYAAAKYREIIDAPA